MPATYMPNLRQHVWSTQLALSGGHGIRQFMFCEGCEFGEQNLKTLSDHVLSGFLLERRDHPDDTRVVSCSNVFRAGVRSAEYQMQLA